MAKDLLKMHILATALLFVSLLTAVDAQPNILPPNPGYVQPMPPTPPPTPWPTYWPPTLPPPTNAPTKNPTKSPTKEPTPMPTFNPTPSPTDAPTPEPTAGNAAIEPQTASRNVFEAAVSMTVFGDFGSATESQVQLFSRIFLQAYNAWDDLNPDKCDPLSRELVNVTDTVRGFTSSRRRVLVEGHGIEEDVTKISNTGISIHRQLQVAPTQSAAPSAAPTSNVGFDNNSVDFLLGFTGTCDGCEADDLLFNDVSGRRRRARTRRLNLRRKLQNSCSGADEVRAPTADEILAIFRQSIQGLDFVTNVTDLREVRNETCPAPPNNFSATEDERTFTLTGVTDVTTASSVDFANALTNMTDPATIIDLHAEFMLGFCDPQYHRLTSAGVGTADLETSGGSTNVVLTYSALDGSCRGCSGGDLFGDDGNSRLRKLRRKRTKVAVLPSESSAFVEPTQRKLQDDEDLCWCDAQAIQRAPTKEEFELFLTEKFNELVITAEVFSNP